MECNDGVCAAKTAGYGDDDIQISSMYTVALHIFPYVNVFKDEIWKYTFADLRTGMQGLLAREE